jgi:hypothetical protein
VNPSKHDVGARLAGGSADLVAAQRVSAVDPDADNVSRLDLSRIECLERLIRDERIAIAAGGRTGQDVEPARGNDPHTERDVAWIDQVYAQKILWRAGAAEWRHAGR